MKRGNKKMIIHIRNDVVDVPKIDINKSAKLVFYTVLKEKALDLIKQSHLSNKLEDWNEFKEYGMDVPIFLELKDLKKAFPKTYTFNKIVEELKVIPLSFSYQDKYYEYIISLFEEIKIDREFKTFSFKFTDKATKYFDNRVLGHFARLDVNEMYKLNSSYAIRLYEFACSHCQKKGSKINSKNALPMDKFRSYMCIPDTYKQHHIDQRILKPSISQINKHTRFNISVEKQKRNKGNKISHIYFDIKESA